MKKRLVWVDQLRSIAFLLVIMGHVAQPKEVQSLIYAFHMPLFFLISGLTINREKLEQRDIREYISHQFKHLIVPYVWMDFLMFPLWYITFPVLHHRTDLSILRTTVGIFYGNNLKIGTPSNALWFLLVLFLANIMYLFIVKIAKGKREVILSLVLICGILGYLDKGIDQIWHFNVAFTAVVFEFIGNEFMIWYKNGGEEWLNNAKRSLSLLVCLLFLGLISHKLNGRVSVTANKFGKSLLLFYISAVTLSFVVIFVMTKIPRISLVEFVGKNTLLYVGIHIPILRLFEALFPALLTNYLYSNLFGLCLYVGIIPICMLANDLCPYVCGKALTENTKLKRLVKVGLAFTAAAFPFGMIMKKIGIWSLGLPLNIVILLVLSIAFVYVTERWFPWVYLDESQKKKVGI